MSRRLGLPVTLKMRHDAHYVETLTSYSGASIGRMIPIDKIRPNPDQPRKHIGDVSELASCFDSAEGRARAASGPATFLTKTPITLFRVNWRFHASDGLCGLCTSCLASKKLPTMPKSLKSR